jgi:hypothetical protein
MRIRSRLDSNPGDPGGRQVVALGLAVVLAVLLVPLSVQAGGVQRVQLVNGAGDLVKAPGGVLDIGDGHGALTVNGIVHPVPQGVPFHLQRKIYGSHQVQVATFPTNARLFISSITATGIVSAGGPPGFVDIFAAADADCANALIVRDFEQFNLSSEPTAEFTFPITTVIAPVGFVPSGPWCIGITSSASMSYTWVTIDGSKEV